MHTYRLFNTLFAYLAGHSFWPESLSGTLKGLSPTEILPGNPFCDKQHDLPESLQNKNSYFELASSICAKAFSCITENVFQAGPWFVDVRQGVQGDKVIPLLEQHLCFFA